MFAVEILLAWLFADFLSGLVHWYEDKVLVNESRFWFINSIKRDNDLHHREPTAMTQFTVWQNMNTTAPLTIPFSALLLFFGAPTILWLGIFFASFANVVHRYAHMPRGKRPKWVRFMQSTGLFISFHQHYRHHFHDWEKVEKNLANSNYCPMTSWLNPGLDAIGFFDKLEKVFGVQSV